MFYILIFILTIKKCNGFFYQVMKLKLCIRLTLYLSADLDKAEKTNLYLNNILFNLKVI